MNNARDTRKLALANADQVTSNLWIGGELDQSDASKARRELTELMSNGVDSIIDCRMTDDDVDWITSENPKIDYLSIGVEDAGDLMPDDWFDDGTEYAQGQIDEGHIVFVCCQAGINRSPSMGFAILLSQGWDPIDALDRIASRRALARIAYAEDAIDWWFRTSNLPAEDCRTQIARVRQWRTDMSTPRRIEQK